MPETYTLASIVEAAEQRYGDLPLTLEDGRGVVLRNALRLPKDDRRRLVRLQRDLERIQNEDVAEGEDSDQTDRMAENLRNSLRIVADSQGGGDALVRELGDNVPALLVVFERYGAVAQPGEASPSAT